MPDCSTHSPCHATDAEVRAWMVSAVRAGEYREALTDEPEYTHLAEDAAHVQRRDGVGVVSPRTLRHAPPAGQDLAGFGIGRAYDNATTARSRRLVALSARAEAVASTCESRTVGTAVLASMLTAEAAADAAVLRCRRDHNRRRAHKLWLAALAADPVLAARYR